MTDSGPALALGVDPPAPHLMRRPPRPRGQGVIDRAMWAGLLLVGITMAIGTLLMFDYGLPGGLIAGSGDVTYARTLAFTTLVLFQLFNVFSARSDREARGRRCLAIAGCGRLCCCRWPCRWRSFTSPSFSAPSRQPRWPPATG